MKKIALLSLIGLFAVGTIAEARGFRLFRRRSNCYNNSCSYNYGKHHFHKHTNGVCSTGQCTTVSFVKAPDPVQKPVQKPTQK